jgi:hypothetical protein
MDMSDTQESVPPAAALLAVMALVFAAYFGLRVAVPELPLHVHQALILLP